MGLFKKINNHIYELLCGKDIDNTRQKNERELKIEKARIEKQAKLEKQRIEKLNKEKRAKEWPDIKDQIYSRHQLPIADDAKNIAKDLLNSNMLSFGKSVDTVSTFFITDERVVKQRYVEGGDKAIDKYANNLIQHAFIGGPITATLLRRLKLLEDAKRDGKVIDTEIDIDGFIPFTKIEYAIDKIELDGQIIPARRKFSIRCEMTATITEGFRVGPFVTYDDLYISTKEEMEQITDEDIIDINLENRDTNKDINKDANKEDDALKDAKKYGKTYNIDVCPHGTDIQFYCNQCQGDIIVSPSKKKVIGILLDISGSMYGDKLQSAKMAIKKILERIPIGSNVNIVLIIFSTDIITGHYEDIIPFGKEYTESVKNMAIERINNVIAGGSTPLYDAINYFLDGIWPGEENIGESTFLLDGNRIFYPYTYLIIISDGEENGSGLNKLIYKGKIGSNAFFAKLKAYRDAGLITEIIPFAYGDSGTDIGLVRELRNISGKRFINEKNSGNIIESLIDNVDSILYGSDNLKMMGLSLGKKNK